MQKLWAILVNFHEEAKTINCIKLLNKQTIKGIGIIVIDSQSTPKSAKVLQKIKGINLIPTSKNLGFAKGVNLGIKLALLKKASRILLVNSDTEFEKNLVEKLLQNRSDIVSPLIKYQRGKKCFYDWGGKINWLWGRTQHHEITTTQKMNFHPDYLSGCCLLVKKNVFEKIGLLDERFFLYFEDVDFCLRAAAAGFKLQVEDQTTLKHNLKGVKNQERKSFTNLYHNLRSNLLFIIKYQKGKRLLLSFTYWLVLSVKVLLNSLL